MQFDISDNVGATPVAAGWVAVTGTTNDPETLSGTDGEHTLVLTTGGDGQDRERNANLFPVDTALWRDFWFVANSTTGGAQALATISGFEPDTKYSVEIWGFDFNSTGTRAVIWTDAVTGNSDTHAFDGSSSPAPASLADHVCVVTAQSDSAGVIRLTGAAAAGGSGGLPNIFINGIRVSDHGAATLPTVEAESGALGADFVVTTIAGATAITPATNNTAFTPVSADRVASYAVTFPSADIYQLYVRVYVGPGTFSDDSFFYASSFGTKSPSNGSDWVAVISGLTDTGFTNAAEQIVVGGGSAGAQVWKWVKFGTFYTVNEGALTQTFQIGSREDGFHIDKFAFAPADVTLTVAELEAGVLPERPPTERFEGADGVALHRFDEPYKATNYEGASPLSGLVLQDGQLWGMAAAGGLQGAGTIYKLALDGVVFDTVNTLPAEIGVSRPAGSLVAGPGGVFYGVSQTGGSSGTGTVFRRNADGTLTILRSFSALAAHTGFNSGGAGPCGTLLLAGSTLYGATSQGGANGQGVLFSVGVDGSGFTVLKEFDAVSPITGYNSGGARPVGGLVTAGGKLYGVASAGGAGGTGLVFSIDANGSNHTALRSFAPLDADTATNLGGAFPAGGLTLVGGRLHGVTLAGGAAGAGTVYSLALDGGSFATLHDFSQGDGAAPVARPSASGNLLYGTSSAGGAGDAGTVFALDVSDGRFRTLHHFEALDADGLNARGAHPAAELLRAGDVLYGTTTAGGPGGTGVVFAIPLPLEIGITTTPGLGAGPTLIVTGRGGPFSSYTIQATDDLALPASWLGVLSGPADASGRLVHTEFNHSAPRRFFRLVTNP